MKKFKKMRFLNNFACFAHKLVAIVISEEILKFCILAPTKTKKNCKKSTWCNSGLCSTFFSSTACNCVCWRYSCRQWIMIYVVNNDQKLPLSWNDVVSYCHGLVSFIAMTIDLTKELFCRIHAMTIAFLANWNLQ